MSKASIVKSREEDSSTAASEHKLEVFAAALTVS